MLFEKKKGDSVKITAGHSLLAFRFSSKPHITATLARTKLVRIFVFGQNTAFNLRNTSGNIELFTG